MYRMRARAGRRPGRRIKTPLQEAAQAPWGGEQRKNTGGEDFDVMKGRLPKSRAAVSLPYQLLVRTQEPATLLTTACVKKAWRGVAQCICQLPARNRTCARRTCSRHLPVMSGATTHSSRAPISALSVGPPGSFFPPRFEAASWIAEGVGSRSGGKLRLYRGNGVWARVTV
jgi:hypothetical protein